MENEEKTITIMEMIAEKINEIMDFITSDNNK